MIQFKTYAVRRNVKVSNIFYLTLDKITKVLTEIFTFPRLTLFMN